MMTLPARAPPDPLATSLTKRAQTGSFVLAGALSTSYRYLHVHFHLMKMLSCRIFKKRSGRKSTGSVSRNSSRASSVSQILTGQRGEFTATENENG